MIAKKYRIPREKISLIMEKGADMRSRLFIIRYIKNNEQFNRYRVIISRKLASKAIQRNRLRRQIYEVARLDEKLDQKSEESVREIHFDLVLIPKKIILEAPFKEIESDLKKVVTNLKNGKT